MTQRTHLDDFLRGRIMGRLECGRTQLEVSDELGIAQSVIFRLWQRFQDDGNVHGRYEQMSEFERGRIVGLKEVGWSYRRIARYLSRSDATIRRCWQEWVNCGRIQRQERSGRETTEGEDRAIVRAALTAPDASLSSIVRANSAPMTTRTIHRRLTEKGLRSQRPLRQLPLTSVQRQARLQWCRAHSRWNFTDWSRIVFSDEFRFELSPDDQRRRVWRRPEQPCDTNLTVFWQTGRQTGMMDWDVISLHSRTPFVVIRRNFTAQRYVDKVLRPVVLPCVSHHSGLTFQQNNARSHTAHVSTACLNACRTLPSPARSPDLSPIEHVWNIMGRANQPARDVDDLTSQLDRNWHDIPQEDIRKLYQSIPR
ncbi:Transposable element Tc1 transposase, partial [Stegodyphus mimosarum]